MSENKTIQQKMDELDKISEWFQGEDFELEEAKGMLERAAELSKEIEHDLKTITNDKKEIKKSFKTD